VRVRIRVRRCQIVPQQFRFQFEDNMTSEAGPALSSLSLLSV
jgi:hypothetical protein